MERVAGVLGGKVVMTAGPDGESFQLELPKAALEKVKCLLSPMDTEDKFGVELAGEDVQLKEIIGNVKEFMSSFAEGNLEKAQVVLEQLSVAGGGELFSGIGGLARELHESLQSLASSLGEELEKMVIQQMPDSGNRLEHVLQLTEEAASTTLDHAEAIQERINRDQEKLTRIERHLAMLKPIGDSAHTRMDDTSQMIRELRESLAQNHEDLSTILTSQGYQDLTGQVITKIVEFQHGLENKLIGLVKGFGGKKTKIQEKTRPDELYGPAHAKVEGAVHSQDDVDAILAQFGF
jgi:chemotaxis regulatin CheY-phosphate phosphatase CheZ